MEREDSSRPGSPQTPDNEACPPKSAAPAKTSPNHAATSSLADRELERVKEKSEAGGALDPLALDDPTGLSVEHVVLRVGIAVALVIVVGILFAQVACKNMQLSGVPNFASGATESKVQSAIEKGVMWGGEVVKLPEGTSFTSYDSSMGTLTVTIDDERSRSVDGAIASAQTPVMAFAMNAFEDVAVQSIVVHVNAHVSEESGSFTGKSSDPMGEVFTIVWQRDPMESEKYTCTITGYDPMESAMESAGASEDA